MTNLLIISHTPHYLHDGHIVGWGPTIREIKNLSRLFGRIIHLAVMHPDPAPQSSLAYEAANIEFVPVSPAGGSSPVDKIRVIQALPGYLRTIHETISRLDSSDLIHVRCPSNISLMALLYLSLRTQPSRSWIKYAGNWSPPHKDFWSYRLQRWLSHQNWTGSLVTINGHWPSQPVHIHSFLNPCLTLDEYKLAVQQGETKQITSPIELLFVGRLEDEKGVMRCLEVAKKLTLEKVQVNLTLVGDGPSREKYATWVAVNGLKRQIHFVGWLPWNSLADYYTRAHIFIFPTNSEGWPKVLGEAMAYGVVPVASAVSSIPQILDNFKVGRSLQPGDINAFVETIIMYLNDPIKWKQESLNGIEAASRFTYDVYLEQLKVVFNNAWGLELPEV